MKIVYAEILGRMMRCEVVEKPEVKTTAKEWRDYAIVRGRVRNAVSGAVANLVDWLPGQYCKVFTGYDKQLAGYVKMPVFETWLKSETAKEANSTPVPGQETH